MTKKLDNIAADLKSRIKDFNQPIDNHLVEFAREYAVSKNLLNQAILKNFRYSHSDRSYKEELYPEIESLIDSIVLDYSENASKETVKNAKNARKQIEDHFFNVSYPSDSVFKSVNLYKKYKRTGFELRDINIDLKFGEITGVVGENGNGKTTLFNIIAGELLHDSGTLNFPYIKQPKNGKLNWIEIDKQIAYVPQELPPWHGALESNLHYEASIRGIKGKENIRSVDYIVQRLGLESELNKKWDELSGGFKLRFSLARALVWKPKLLLIDEPLANLDVTTQQIVLNDLRDIAKNIRFPISIITSSQHIHEIESISDKLLFLEDGKVGYYGAVENVGDNRNTNCFELECNNSLGDLRDALSEVPSISIFHNGLYCLINASLDVSSQDILQKLIANNIEVDYFRNISQSIKYMFTKH
ncbi:MAG: ABC transporter ATP-binding protein [Saprospiraceae bacterium]|nr:ABC transporter ATP-binding protein [Saprospiraceae bacterium]